MTSAEIESTSDGKTQSRLVVADGDVFLIEYAWNKLKEAPACQFLENAKESSSLEDLFSARDVREINNRFPFDPPSPRMIVEEFCARIADGLMLKCRKNYMRLDAGLWEIKLGDLRITFYDTDGVGQVCGSEISWGTSIYDSNPWPLGDFEEYLRLTTAFIKDSEKTPPAQLAYAKQIRREDFEHDRSP